MVQLILKLHELFVGNLFNWSIVAPLFWIFLGIHGMRWSTINSDRLYSSPNAALTQAGKDTGMKQLNMTMEYLRSVHCRPGLKFVIARHSTRIEDIEKSHRYRRTE